MKALIPWLVTGAVAIGLVAAKMTGSKSHPPTVEVRVPGRDGIATKASPSAKATTLAGLTNGQQVEILREVVSDDPTDDGVWAEIYNPQREVVYARMTDGQGTRYLWYVT